MAQESAEATRQVRIGAADPTDLIADSSTAQSALHSPSYHPATPRNCTAMPDTITQSDLLEAAQLCVAAA